MFKMKTKKKALDLVRNSVMHSSDILGKRVLGGAKYAGDKMIYLYDYMGKTPGLNLLKHRVQKHPVGSTMTIAGIGLTLWGILKLMRK